MKNAIVKLGISVLFLFSGFAALAAPPVPTVSLVGPANTSSSSIVFNVTFDRAVTGFGDAASDVTLSGAAATGATAVVGGSGTNYTITVTLTTNGLLTVKVPGAAAVSDDPGAENNTASNSVNVTFDNVKPSVTVNKKTGQADPTQVGPVLFTILFSEDIDGSTFNSSDISFTGSTTGGGTLSVGSITPVTGQSEFEVVVNLSGSAVPGNVIASIAAGAVSDLAGNTNTVSTSTDNSVQYTGGPPTLGAPTVTNIDDTSADLGGVILSANGNAITERGSVWSFTAGVTIADHKSAEGGTAVGAFSQTRSASITAATQIFFRAYAINAQGTTLSSESSFWTLSTAPSSAPTPTLAPQSTSSMRINFPAANTISNTSGYIILRRVGSEPPTSDAPDGVYPTSLTPASSTLVAHITDKTATFYDDSGLTPCTDYYYVAVLYNWDGVHPETTNYRYGGATFNDANATTWCQESDIVLKNAASATLAYSTKQAASITGTSDGLQIMSLTLRDGGTGGDADAAKTELQSIKIQIDNWENLRQVAYIEGGYTQSLAAANVMTFNIPNNTSVANDDGTLDFSFYASFQSVVDDGEVVRVRVLEATVRSNVNSAGSEFGTLNAGGADTGTTNNKIAVVATQIVTSGVSSPINPNNDWGFTATMKDALNNIDTDASGSITLSIPGGEGTLSGTVTKALSSGVAVWTDLQFDAAGTKHVNLNSTTIVGTNDGTLVVNALSLGVVITGPTQILCFNDNSTTSTTYTTLGAIKVKESDKADFGAGTNQTFSLILPSGFVFDTSVTGAAVLLTKAGNEITNLSFVGYTGVNIARIKYDISGTTNATKDEFTINGLKVKYTSTSNTPVAAQPILRVGGSAMIEGDADTDLKAHGTLAADNGATTVSFVNVAPAGATETSFSKLNTARITLQGVKASDNSNLPGVFFGDGVALDGDGKYKFTPSAVATGSHDIQFEYTDPVAPNCKSVAVKPYSVYTTAITGLSTEYCEYDAPVTLGAAVNPVPPDICYYNIIGTFPTFILDPVYKFSGAPKYFYSYTQADFSWVELPKDGLGNYVFSPTSFTPGATVTVGVGYLDLICPTNNAFGGYMVTYRTVVTINSKPTFTITTNTSNGICSTDAVINLSASSFDAAGTYDEFWSSQVGNPGNVVLGVIGDRPTGFKFDPALANSTGATNIVVQLNFKHQDPTTGCNNTAPPKLLSVWRKPPQVPVANIKVDGVSTTTAAFCLDQPSKPFVATDNPAFYYRWYQGNKGTELTPTSPIPTIPPADRTFLPTVPRVVSSTQFSITQTEHRNTAAGFAGCESDTRLLSFDFFGLTTVSAGNATSICEGNPLDLTSIGASINSPLDANLNGTWSSLSASPGTFKNATVVDDRFLTATQYFPSAAEIAAGQTTLRLTSDDPTGPCTPVFGDVLIRIFPNTSIVFTQLAPPNPITHVDFCANNSDMTLRADLVGFTTGVTVSWSVVAGGGSFDPLTIAQKDGRYVPTATELNDGATVTTRLTTSDPDGTGPCQPATKDLTVKISQRSIAFAPADFEICSDVPINLTARIPNGPVTGDVAKSSATSVTWVAADGAGTLSNATSLTSNYSPFNPPPLGDGSVDPASETKLTRTLKFVVTPNDPGGTNVCKGEPEDVLVTLVPRAATPDPTPVPSYCVGDVVGLLKVGGTYPTWYDNADLASIHKLSSGNNSLATGVVADGEKRVSFFVTDTNGRNLVTGFAGCESPSIEMIVVVNPLPVPDFTIANQCLGEIMQFTDASTLAGAPGTRTISTWQWNFDDGFGRTDASSGPIPAGTQDGRTTGTYENPGHLFKSIGNYNVTLALKTSDGCAASITKGPIPVGPVPIANFSVGKLCDQDATEYKYAGTEPLAITNYTWNFGDAASGASNASTAAAPTHQFTGVGTYNVTLTVSTALNCSSTVSKNTSILPYVKSFPYVQDFESAGHGWVSAGLNDNLNSWNLVSAAGSITSDPNGGSKFWVTRDLGTGTYFDNERSVLYGPCVDMTTLSRPVVAMDYWSDTDLKSDGAYVEVMDESVTNPVWERLGDNISGLNWYDENSIGGLAALNGVGQNVSQFGWSGEKPGWRTGRYNLDALSTKTRLRFRIVFGSNSSQPIGGTFDGFAMDFFKLETRNRLVLVENFTNAQATGADANVASFKTFPSVAASNEVVKIQYHTSFPSEADAIYKQNPMDPNARASFYGLSAGPRGYIDGYTNATGAGLFTGTWASTYYNTESLVTSPLDITINNPTATGGTVRITGTVKAREFALPVNQYSLYIAVVEDAVGTQGFVLRKMLPSAAGIKIPAVALGQTFAFDQSWAIESSAVSDPTKLMVVAFVQADIPTGATDPANPTNRTKQVLQAAVNKVFPPISFTTGLELPLVEQTAMYPNPADKTVNIVLPQPTQTGVDVNVVDQLGRSVVRGFIAPGESSTSLEVGHLAGAVYIVQLKENGVSGGRRLLITHRN